LKSIIHLAHKVNWAGLGIIFGLFQHKNTEEGKMPHPFFLNAGFQVI
jgi:hypothetical protein